MKLQGGRHCTPAAGMQRVKVYRLTDEGSWADKGTGSVSVEFMEQANAMGLVVVSEEDARTLLVHKVSREDIYNRQGEETIIMWSDPDIGTDIALSFQEATGCNAIWEQIQHIQREPHSRLPENVPPGYHKHVGMVDELEEVHPMEESADDEDGAVIDHLKLPFPDMGNLSQIAKILTDVPHYHRDAVSQQLRPEVVEKLLDIFKQLDDLEEQEGLGHMYQIMKGAIMLADTSVLELLLDERHVMEVVGALENDPDSTQRQDHRGFLQKHALFKEVVPITNPEVKRKIHQSYRMGYLKDVVLPRVLDDSTFATLSSLMLFNSVDILQGLLKDPRFFPELFRRLSTVKAGEAEWLDLVQFLQELCLQMKHLQPSLRADLLAQMAKLGLYEVMTDVIQKGSPQVQLRAMDVLLSALQHNPPQLRAFMLQQRDHTLFTSLITALKHGADGGLQEQVVEILRLLLDPESMDQTSERSEFLEVFYDKYIQQLIGLLEGKGRSGPKCVGSSSVLGKRREREDDSGAPKHAGSHAAVPNGILPLNGHATPKEPSESASAAAGAQQPQAENGISRAGADLSTPSAAQLSAEPEDSRSETVRPSTLGLIVDLLCFCVQHHSFRIKYYTLRNNVVEKVLQLLQRREKYLALGAIRFVRTCLGLKDDFYHRYLVRNNLFEPIVAMFVSNGNRYNMIYSGVLDLLEFVRRENIKILVAHLAEDHLERMRQVDVKDILDALQLKHDQNTERPAHSMAMANALQPRQRRDVRAMEREEESYFDEEDEDEPAAQPGPRFGRQPQPLGLSPQQQQRRTPQVGPPGTSPLRSEAAGRTTSPGSLLGTSEMSTGSLVDYGSDED